MKSGTDRRDGGDQWMKTDRAVALQRQVQPRPAGANCRAIVCVPVCGLRSGASCGRASLAALD